MPSVQHFSVLFRAGGRFLALVSTDPKHSKIHRSLTPAYQYLPALVGASLPRQRPPTTSCFPLHPLSESGLGRFVHGPGSCQAGPCTVDQRHLSWQLSCSSARLSACGQRLLAYLSQLHLRTLLETKSCFGSDVLRTLQSLGVALIQIDVSGFNAFRAASSLTIH